MSSPKTRSKATARRPSWFQDTKSGCEKQTDYFLKIRKLQKELIKREQHNLVNAMERLKQLQYPRRKPMVRNFPSPEKGASSAFPRRTYARSLHGHKYPEKDKMIKPLKGEHLLPEKTTSVEDQGLDSLSLEDIRYLYNRMLPVLNDQQIAKIASEVRSTFPNEPSTYLLQPHLPSIPNVKRKATTRLENRLKLLTLSEESQYRTLNVPKIATSLALHKKRHPHDSSRHEDQEEKKTKKIEQRNILHFDIDPNDSSVFVHSAHDKHHDHHDDDDEFDDHDHEKDPLPPPNARPNSLIASKKNNLDPEPDNSEQSYNASLENNQPDLNAGKKHGKDQDDCEQSCEVSSSLESSHIDLEKAEEIATERFPASKTGESKENSITENNEVEQINDGDKNYKEKTTNVDITVLEEKTAESPPLENASKDNDMDVTQELNDNHDALTDVNITEPKVVIKTNKPPTEKLNE